MTKKQYFLFLWAIGSLDSLFVLIIDRAITIWRLMGHIPQGEMVGIATALATIILFGIFLYIGLYCAQRIGARLLLLQENYSVLNDIVKPAVIAGSLYAIAVLCVYYVNSITLSLLFNTYLYTNFLRALLLTFRYDVFFLLFCVSTLSFIIKKIFQNLSMAIVLSVSAGLVIIFGNGPLLNVIMGRRVEITIDTWFFVATYALLTALFWKKGLEVALLCSIIITTILYFIAPLLLHAPHINIYI